MTEQKDCRFYVNNQNNCVHVFITIIDIVGQGRSVLIFLVSWMKQ